MKRIFIAALCGMLACVGMQAQKVAYTYDSGGNRISKRIIVITPSAKAASGSVLDDEETTGLDEVMADEGGITISATDDGRVSVSISDDEWTGSATVTAYSHDGRQVLSMPMNESNAQADLGNVPSGVYVFTVKTGRRTRTWKLSIR